jgi:predicted lipoprotein with Yx(FWY)xxD motif
LRGGAVAAVAGLALACVGVSAGASTTKSVVISTLTTSKLGTILVSGRTVYTLKPSGPACTATCLKYWPPVLLPKGTTKAKAGAGVNAAKLGTVKRGSALQVTYAGKALYFFSGDKAAGMVKGNVKDTWGRWSDVVLKAPATTGTPTTTTTAPSGGGTGF